METTSKVNEVKSVNLRRIVDALKEIGSLEIDDFNLKYSITQTIANLNGVGIEYTKALAALQKKYVIKDEKGDLVSEKGFFVFENKEDKEKYLQEFDALNETVVDENITKIHRLKTSQLQKIKGLKGTTMANCHELIIDDLNIK